MPQLTRWQLDKGKSQRMHWCLEDSKTLILECLEDCLVVGTNQEQVQVKHMPSPLYFISVSPAAQLYIFCKVRKM